MADLNEVPLGAIKTSDGRVIVPPTRRPDGTFRKEVRIREGYIPPDEQRAFRTRRQMEREREQELENERRLEYNKLLRKSSTTIIIEPTTTRSMSKAQRKNEARKKKRQEKVADVSIDEAIDDTSKQIESLGIASEESEKKSEKGETLDVEKQIKNLRKKIKQIDELQLKIDQQSITPDVDQLEKLQRKPALVEQLQKLIDTAQL